MNDIKQLSQKYIYEIEMALKEYIVVKYPNIIYEAMSYSIFSGGKRLRPTLLLATNSALGGDLRHAKSFACAIEMIHTYSLIHDDLPALDNDHLRRGKPTNHVVYGENIAILAGDALLNTAYEIMGEECIAINSTSAIAAMVEISRSAGTTGMIGGQVQDVISEDKKIDKNTLLYIHENKTAALIRGAIVAGALLAKGSKENIALLKEAGLKLGLAFQIKDDILDVTSNTKTLGKPIKSDEKNNKATYVSIFGLKQAEKDYLDLSGEAVKIFEKLGDWFLVNYARSIIGRNK